MGPGLISHLLPTPQAAPQLARLFEGGGPFYEGNGLPSGWRAKRGASQAGGGQDIARDTGLNVVSLDLTGDFIHKGQESEEAEDAEGADKNATAMDLLASDATCLAAISGTVACQGLLVHSLNESFQLGHLSAVLRPLGPFLTHLSVEAMFKDEVDIGWGKELALALPGLQVMRFFATWDKLADLLPAGRSFTCWHLSITLPSFAVCYPGY